MDNGQHAGAAPAENGSLSRYREHYYRHALYGEKRHMQLFSQYDVSLSEFRTLLYLIEATEGAEPSRMADELVVSRQTMTNIIDVLQRRGLVERISHTEDRRRVIVRLLPAGLELANALSAIENDYSARIYRHFTPEELAEYHRLSDKMQRAKDTELTSILGSDGKEA